MLKLQKCRRLSNAIYISEFADVESRIIRPAFHALTLLFSFWVASLARS